MATGVQVSARYVVVSPSLLPKNQLGFKPIQQNSQTGPQSIMAIGKRLIISSSVLWDRDVLSDRFGRIWKKE